MSDARNPLRIGILLDSETIKYWQYSILEELKQSEYAEIKLIVVKAPANSSIPEKSSLAKKVLYKYLAWDQKFKCNPKVDPFAENNLDVLDLQCVKMTVKPISTKWIDKFSDEDNESIAQHDLDLIIRFGFRILHGKILSIPTYGVWSYHHGNNLDNRGGPPAFWEIYKSLHTTGVTLQVLSESLDGGQVIARTAFAADEFSVNRTKERVYLRSMSMAPAKIQELYKTGPEAFFKRAKKLYGSIDVYDKPLLTLNNISPVQALMFVGHSLFKYAHTVVEQKRKVEKWRLYYRFADNMSTTMWQFKSIESKNDRYWADPFVFTKDDRFYIYVEDYIYKTKKGHISVLELDGSGDVKSTKVAIDEPHHLSYPFIFENADDLYMIPESRAARSINLYKNVAFPDKWELIEVLMDDIDAVDTTLYYKDELWWMFTNVNTYGTHDELHLFSSPSLEGGNWVPHPENPIVTDVKYARPAGSLFELDNELFRPTQDCTLGYGHSMNIQKIITLTPSHYEEIAENTISPDWQKDITGTHTLTYVPGLTVVDAKTAIKKLG